MLGIAIAWDSEGNIIATLQHLVARDELGNAIGLVDFDVYENAGLKFRLKPERPDAIWSVPGALGSAAWPEFLSGMAHDFRVGDYDGQRVLELVHVRSGHRRQRKRIDAAIAKRIKDAKGEPADLRDLVGGINRPLKVDMDGRNEARQNITPIGWHHVKKLGGLTVADPDMVPIVGNRPRFANRT